MADPYFYQTALLMPFNGAEGATTFADASVVGAKSTAFGAAKITTAQSKFGGSCLSLDGAASYVVVGSMPTDFRTNDFTVEFWLKTTDNNAVILDHFNNTVGSFECFLTAAGKLQWYTTAALFTGAATVNDGNWHHVAYSRASGTLRQFVDGVLDASATDNTDYNLILSAGPYMSGQIAIGAQVYSRNATYDFAGYIDDLRITKGIARYTAAFTPPTVANDTAPLPISYPFIAYNSRVLTPRAASITKPTVKVQSLFDYYHSGKGRVSGTTKVKGTPNFAVQRRVRLFREVDGKLVREQWSNPVTGAYSFDYVDPAYKYTVVAYDHVHDFRAVIADNITADPLAYPT